MTPGQQIQPTDINPYELRTSRSSDENLEEFADVISHVADRLVIFLGAGASIGARSGPSLSPMPSAVYLRDEMWKRFMLPRGAEFEAKQISHLPLDQVSAFAVAKVGREPVAKFIAERFQTYKPLWQHLVLPYLNPKSLFTTNYDLLVEQGWRLEKEIKPLVTIFSESHRIIGNQTPLYKPHGSADRALDPIGAGGPIITTIDYFEMLTAKRSLLEKWLNATEGACVLLIGYSMSDMDIGSELYRLRKTCGVNWYGVFPRSENTVRKYWSEFLKIRPIDRRFAEFIADLDNITNFIPAKHKYDQIPVLQANGLIQ